MHQGPHAFLIMKGEGMGFACLSFLNHFIQIYTIAYFLNFFLGGVSSFRNYLAIAWYFGLGGWIA